MELTDPVMVRARLEQERVWSAFSLADLDEPYASHASWFGSSADSGIVLLYRAFDPPLLVLHGAEKGCAEALDDLARSGALPEAYVTTSLPLLPVIEQRYRTFDKRLMVRMHLRDRRDAPPAETATEIVRLRIGDLDAVQALYREEPPAFFLPMLLEQGVYVGAREAGALVAIAGTHVVSTRAGVAAVGNVYTRRDRRRRGLAARVTKGVTDALCAMGVSTIVLNVVASNEGARRIYERLGFEEYCRFYEGPAVARQARAPA